ncbi:MAG: nucleotide exchange factor GrpE [Sedimentisphaerales bacterium]|nr:nucleotide exchange factor GrpE [Sedimentisphaerales bacterium]
MRMKSMIFGLVLLLAGGVTLGWILTEIRSEQWERTRYQSEYSRETADYMKQYDEWLLLPADERTAFPQLLDKNGNNQSIDQLKREQHKRLLADLDTLASDRTNVHPFADVLYGESWPVEVEAYKKLKARNENILTGSIVCTSMGGVIYVWWLLFAIAQATVNGLRSLKQRMETSKVKPQEEIEQEAEVDGPEDMPPEEQILPQSKQDQKHPKVLLNSNWGNWKPVKHESEIESEASQIKRISGEVERIASLLSDEKATRVDAVKAKPLDDEEESKPIDNTLKQLSEEVSAIREYTSYQQDRLEKLQDGYDWNIIRTFCLRVIRCIDNLDNRINQLNSKTKVTYLTEVRDELIFALESSGVEQFEPEINSEYRGQEKIAEAVKDREPNEEPEQRGKIASVIRPGYQYFISEENIKIVRPAQVRLFD